MDSDLSVYYSGFADQVPRNRVMFRTDLGFSFKPEKLRQFDTISGDVCFVDLPYKCPPRRPTLTEDGEYDWVPKEEVVFVKGHPTKILFSDRLDSGLCRLRRYEELQTTDSKSSESKLHYGDKDFRVWLELNLLPDRNRLSNTKVMLASHHFCWKTDQLLDKEDPVYKFMVANASVWGFGRPAEFIINKIIR